MIAAPFLEDFTAGVFLLQKLLSEWYHITFVRLLTSNVTREFPIEGRYSTPIQIISYSFASPL